MDIRLQKHDENVNFAQETTIKYDAYEKVYIFNDIRRRSCDVADVSRLQRR